VPRRSQPTSEQAVGRGPYKFIRPTKRLIPPENRSTVILSDDETPKHVRIINPDSSDDDDDDDDGDDGSMTIDIRVGAGQCTMLEERAGF